MVFSDDQLLAFGREINRRLEASGFPPDRIGVFMSELQRTHDSDAAKRKALDGLIIQTGEKDLVDAVLGGNPIAQLLREGWVSK